MTTSQPGSPDEAKDAVISARAEDSALMRGHDRIDRLPAHINPTTPQTCLMSQLFLITTDLFEAITPGAHFINLTVGEDFATWLQAALKQRTLLVPDPVQEDFGWILLITHDQRWPSATWMSPSARCPQSGGWMCRSKSR